MTSPNLPDRILNVGSAFMRVVNLLMWSLYLFLVLLAVASTLLVFVARSHNGYCDSGIREHGKAFGGAAGKVVYQRIHLSFS